MTKYQERTANHYKAPNSILAAFFLYRVGPGLSLINISTEIKRNKRGNKRQPVESLKSKEQNGE